MEVNSNDEAEARLRSAFALHRRGRLDDAEALYREVLAGSPRSFEALHWLGILHAQKGDYAAALRLLEDALAVNGRSASAHSNRGNVLRGMSRREEAIASYDRALELDPQNAEAYCNRGAVLHELGRYPEALQSCERAIAIKPGHVQALSNRGNVLNDAGRHAEALESYAAALAADPRHAPALLGRGNALHALHRDDEAFASYAAALAANPGFAHAPYSQGRLLESQGRTDEAIGCYERALAIAPDSPAIHDACIFATVRVATDPARIYAAAKAYGERFESGVRRVIHRNSRDPDRRLRIGYVSGDFRAHAMAQFIEPVLAGHDKREVEVFCYSNHRGADPVTRRIASHADHWREIASLGDDAVAALVQEDGVDILVDLSGHTLLNRLLVFARKPAPVQITWLGLPCTTGLTVIDYRFTSRHVDPPGAERWNTEALVRLSPTCFTPRFTLPEVGPPPAVRNGYVTFASFNDPNKITAATYALWSRVLAAVPGSRMLLLMDAHCRARLEQGFAAHGIGAERLIAFEKAPLGQYYASHNDVDIALDPFPYNGGTTTRNALWMGLPVVTLAGETPVSRVGLALLTEIGLEGLVARSADDYVDIAMRLAGDVAACAELRRTMRDRLHAATGLITDAALRAREVEAAYRALWRRWCDA